MSLHPNRRHILAAASMALPSLAWPQAAGAPQAITVAGWSKPITEVTPLLIDEDKGFYRAQGLALVYLPGTGGGDAVRNLLSGQAFLKRQNTLLPPTTSDPGVPGWEALSLAPAGAVFQNHARGCGCGCQH